MHNKGFYEKYVKRPQDFLCALAATIVLSPVMGTTAILVKKKLGSPVLFTQERPGLNGKIFKLYKFRTMTDEKDEYGNLLPDDVRLTPFGEKLRSTSIDELPELFNILKGDMAVVGPRPVLVRDVIFMTDDIKKRHSVLPGLTGLAQIRGRNRITWEQKYEYDLEYINEGITLLKDWGIIFETVGKVFLKKDIERENTVSDIDYGDWILKKGEITIDDYNRKQELAQKTIEEFRDNDLGIKKNWRYYNHAIISDLSPDSKVDIACIKNKKIWKIFKKEKPLFIRWTTNFDCGYETKWWYLIKDESFDISKLKAKRRYVINKGVKNFEIKKIEPNDYIEELFQVTQKAYKEYSKNEKAHIDKVAFLKTLSNWTGQYDVFAAFFRENGVLCGYSVIKKHRKYLNFFMQKTNPEYEKYEINAALVYEILKFYDNELCKGVYICDGERTISHDTHFQEYLEKYFEFRKAYCNLHLEYNPKLKILMSFFYKNKDFFEKYKDEKYFNKINSILKMEEISRGSDN